MLKLRTLILALAIVLTLSEGALGQVMFQPSNCDFRVWFAAQPSITKATVPTADGILIETTIAELNPILDDGYAHYFRAECSQLSLGARSQAEMIEDMTELASLNRLENSKAWVEVLPSGQMIGHLRASIDSGQRIYFFDIRRYLSENNVFDAWAGAEQYPTEGISQFFKSVAYRGSIIHK